MICFTWNGFPQYAARCIGAFVASAKDKVVVVATKPDIPITGMEQFCNCPVYWIGENDKVNVKELLGEIPTHLFSSGWSVGAFNHIAKEVKKSGGKVILQNDITFNFSLRDILKAIRFRLFFRRKYDAYFVPGMASKRAMNIYGVKSDRVIGGVYAADNALFGDGEKNSNRDKKIVYVGRFDSRKNVLRLCEAFLKSLGPENGWTLELYGCGEEECFLPRNHSKIKVNGFLQPEEIAKIYRTSRCFVLPSLEEPWGVVVHEAALSGCVLLLSNRVSAAEDLLNKKNGMTFNPKSTASIVSAFKKLYLMDDNALNIAHDNSLLQAQKFSKENFVSSVKVLLH